MAQTKYGGGLDNGFVSKLDSSGNLLLSTYLGGSFLDVAQSVDVDGSGNVYVAGYTQSSDFPGTAAGLQNTNVKGTQASSSPGLMQAWTP